MTEDEHRGYREYGTCGDCGGMRYRFFSIATQSWGEMPRHLMGENCIKNLQRRIAAIETAIQAAQAPALSHKIDIPIGPKPHVITRDDLTKAGPG